MSSAARFRAVLFCRNERKESLAFWEVLKYNKLIYFTYFYRGFACVSEKFGSAGL